MKRYLILALCLLLLLTGCRAESADTPTTGETSTSTEPAQTTPPTELPVVPLLEQGEAVGESENLI